MSRVSGLFSRRGYNIDSLSVGETYNPDQSRMTIVVRGDESTLEQIEKQLNKKLDVIKVKTFHEKQCFNRELLLIKIKYNKNNRRDIMEICESMKAEIVDVSKHYMLIELCDTPERINAFMTLFASISIVEVARTGTVALSMCKENED